MRRRVIDVQGYGQGYYQFTVWHTDGRKTHNKSRQSSGKGFSLRFEQCLGEDILPFVTYSRASGGATSVRQLRYRAAITISFLVERHILGGRVLNIESGFLRWKLQYAKILLSKPAPWDSIFKPVVA